MIYFDHNATTALDEEVLEAMLPYLKQHYANSSSRHGLGLEAKKGVDAARSKIADLLGCDKREVIFTSGGTEANNLALKGTLATGQFEGKHVVIGGGEHPSVKYAAKQLEKQGFEISVAAVNEFGEVTAEAVAACLRKDTALVSVMHAQNEVGTVNNIEEIAEALGHRRILFHTDAAQTVGKIPTSFPFMGTQMMTVAAHKFHGPKGIGALIANTFVKFEAQNVGGSHEGGRRGGTLNVPGIVGFAKALELAWGSRLAEHGETLTALRDYLHLRFTEELEGVLLNGHIKDRLPNTLNLSFMGVSSAELAQSLKTVALSTGAACHDQSAEPSEIMKAMGIERDRALASVRISIGRDNTVEEADQAIDEIVKAVKALREKSSSTTYPQSMAPQCPRCQKGLGMMSTSGGMLVKCVDYDNGCKHLLPLPGTRPPE